MMADGRLDFAVGMLAGWLSMGALVRWESVKGWWQDKRWSRDDLALRPDWKESKR